MSNLLISFSKLSKKLIIKTFSIFSSINFLNMNFSYLIFLFSFIFFLNINPSHAQQNQFKFDHFALKQGLSQTNIYAIVQDSSGFLWFGTQDGLNKFDAYNFKVFHHISGDSTSLPDDWITALKVDDEGNLWVGSISGGVSKFDIKTNKFENYQGILEKNNNIKRGINCLLIDKQDFLWIGTNGDGLFRYNIKNDSFSEFVFTKNINSHQINSIFEDKDGIIWIGTTNDGVIKYDYNKDTFENFSDYTEYSYILKNITAILKDSKNNMWFGTEEHGLLQYNLKKQIFRHFTYFSSKAASLSANSITQLFKDSQDNIWVGTTAGLNLYSSESNSFKRIVYDPRDPSSIMGKQILFVFEDQSGVLWIGTEEGLNKYDKRQNVFEHIKHDPVNSNSLCNNNIWIICEDHKGRLWFGTDNGMSCFNSQNGRFTTYQTEKKNQNSISHNIVRTIIEDDIGNLWIGTNGGGLNKLDNRRSGFTVLKHDPEDPNSISSNSIRSLYQDKFGTLWIGTWDGLDEYFPHSNLINHYKNDPDNQNSISDNRVRTIYEDRKGNFWIGTYGGLNLFDRDKKKFISYISDDSDLNGLSNDRVLCIHEDQSGQLWIGTFKGLNKFDKKGNKFYHYTTKNGLPNDVIYGILEDEQGFLWVSTNKGLSKFNPGLEKISFRNFNVEDGLQSNEFNGGAYLKMKNSELIFGGIKGVSKFSPENIVENTYIPPVVFTAFNIYNEQIQFEQSINYIQEITLSYKDDFFSLEFAALDYTNPVKNQYTYMLEGYNENWIKAGNRHYASYTNLDGGEYIFKVKGSNSGGKWNEIPKSVRIIIIPPFYATWSFRILIILLLGVIGFSTYKIKVRSIAKQREILKQQVDEQTAKLKKRNSALKKAENAAQQFAAQASLLNEVGQRVSGVLDLNTLLNEIVISARDAFDYYGVMLFLKEEEKEAFRLQSIAGGYKDIFPKDISIKMGEGMIGRAAQTHEIQLSNDVTQNPHYVKKVGEITCSELSVPIKVEDEVIAVLDIQSDEKDIFKETDVAMLETFSTQIEAAINNARLYEKSQNEIADRQRAEAALRKSRDNLTNAKKETDNILKNVEEGLFLLDSNGEISSQYSKSLEHILEESKIADKKFINLLKNKIPDKVLESVEEYLELMFRVDIEEEMIGELNPLSEIMLSYIDKNGNTIGTKNLAFRFKRITGYKDRIYKLISTVSDITEQIKMARKIQEIEAQQKKQMEWMISILHVETPLLIEFLAGVKREIELIGALLKKDHLSGSFKQDLEEIYRSMHTVKGNAGLLDLKLFLKLAHDFEEKIIVLQEKEEVSGRDFVALVLKLEDIKKALKDIEELFDRISNLQTHFRPKRSFESEIFINSLDSMITNLSIDEGKEVEFIHDEFNPNHIPFRFRLTGKEILVQLARNSLTHGIEKPEERIAKNKPAKGIIQLSSFVRDNQFGIVYKDDGRGLQLDKLKQKALATSKWDEEEINTLNDSQIAELIFEPGISTIDEVNMTAGRGIGMDIIKHKIEEVSGTIEIDFKEGKYCKFTFVLPANRK